MSKKFAIFWSNVFYTGNHKVPLNIYYEELCAIIKLYVKVLNEIQQVIIR